MLFYPNLHQIYNLNPLIREHNDALMYTECVHCPACTYTMYTDAVHTERIQSSLGILNIQDNNTTFTYRVRRVENHKRNIQT